MGLEAEVAQHLGDPSGAVGGLEGDGRAPSEPGQLLSERLPVVGDVSVADLVSFAVQDADLGAVAMHVHSDEHGDGPPPSSTDVERT